MLISRTLRLFLDSIGRREEYEFYLKKFQAEQSVCFALVAPDTAAVEQSGDLMTFDLQFLLRLELTPLMVLAGLDATRNAHELSAYGDYEVLADLAPDAPESTWRERLKHAYARERIPILLLPETELGDAVEALTPRIAKRIHLLRVQGMLRATDEEKIFYHYTHRVNPHVLAERDRPAVQLGERWLRHDPSLHISVASPLHLLQEMFTVRGMGSIIRPGSTLEHHTSLEAIDVNRLALLMREAFGKALRDPESLRAASDIYLETRYRGAVVLESHPAGKYLSKFAVGTEARGEGLAQELWQEACAPQPALFWRSRSNNPINQWYERHAGGHHREGDWTLFWKGVRPEQLPEIIRYALERPGDFVEAPQTSNPMST
ncbi:MAG: hypothetical protein JJU29_00940 [Verrucomicrobia bacterium]|nr:hypothetical protein [Verrucomicrobiota bacterium]MCH8510527.1 hypothetical protein [Kiritimatiellia bacterium]